MAITSLDYFPISPLLPIEDMNNVHKWHRFITPDNDSILYSLIARVYVNSALDVVVHKSFINAMREVVNRKAVRGQDYVIFASWNNEEKCWYAHARIDRHFISEEDVINE